MDSDLLTANISVLKVPDSTKRDLASFVNQLTSFYRSDLLSIMAFGSCVSGDYHEGVSDVNLMVVYSDLNIADLGQVADLAQEWLKKRSFFPRFLSRRNLRSWDTYFQVDMLEMKGSHVVLVGEDLIAQVEIVPKNLHWQLSYEIKAMRSRIKQQFWRTAGDAKGIRMVLVRRFTSLIHLTRALLYLTGKETPVSHVRVMEVAGKELGIDPVFVGKMFRIKSEGLSLEQSEALQAFESLMDTIRILDERCDEVRL